jgi:hypothetical protein
VSGASDFVCDRLGIDALQGVSTPALWAAMIRVGASSSNGRMSWKRSVASLLLLHGVAYQDLRDRYLAKVLPRVSDDRDNPTLPHWPYPLLVQPRARPRHDNPRISTRSTGITSTPTRLSATPLPAPRRHRSKRRRSRSRSRLDASSTPGRSTRGSSRRQRMARPSENGRMTKA